MMHHCRQTFFALGRWIFTLACARPHLTHDQTWPFLKIIIIIPDTRFILTAFLTFPELGRSWYVQWHFRWPTYIILTPLACTHTHTPKIIWMWGRIQLTLANKRLLVCAFGQSCYFQSLVHNLGDLTPLLRKGSKGEQLEVTPLC